jgi:hypothetical protein
MVIFFIEDERDDHDNILNCLIGDHTVSNFDSVTKAYSQIKEKKDTIDLFVFDIQMACGSILNQKEAENGTVAGIIFYKKIYEEIYKYENVPPVIFVSKFHYTDETVLKYLNINKSIKFGYVEKNYCGLSFEEFPSLFKLELEKLGFN